MRKQVIVTYTSLSVGWLLLMIAIFSFILSGCTKEQINGSGNVITEKRSTSSFTDVEIGGSFEIHLLQDSSSVIEIRAEDNVIPAIETYIRQNTLYVRVESHARVHNTKPMQLFVHSPLFQRVSLAGSGSVQNSDTLRSSLFDYEVNGNGDANLLLAVSDIKATVNGSGNIQLKGKATALVSDINGSGSIRGLGLNVQHAGITIRGSGDHSIQVVRELEASIYGSGSVSYLGTPSVHAKIYGSGKVIKL
ncbi:head GIN domain-containing protein [Chitinophaga vietnamensis]|uniref:head GIN domain-containing protein n=1 Tax=Chitinophaga vietnamensis TaxID=2593957 RepID=UPI001177E7A0|nr:head GIN domain-containing protein [Chitinophaga vietnamensis]